MSERHLVMSQIGLACETAERGSARALKSGWAAVVIGYARLRESLRRPKVRPMSGAWLAGHEVEFQKQHPDA